MEVILNDTVSPKELEKFEKNYMRELSECNTASAKTTFEFANCLVRSKYGADIHNGIKLFENLCKDDPENKRDYIYYIIVGYTRIKDFTNAKKYIKAFLDIEPDNLQVSMLDDYIDKEIKNEMVKDATMAGGALLAIGGIVGLAFALAKK